MSVLVSTRLAFWSVILPAFSLHFPRFLPFQVDILGGIAQQMQQQNVDVFLTNEELPGPALAGSGVEGIQIQWGSQSRLAST